MGVELTCEHCGKKFIVRPYKVGRARFCSKSCLGHDNAKRLKPNTKPNKTSFKPGTMSGRNNPRFVEPVKLVCKNCGGNFERKPWELRGSGRRGDFCSAKCRGEYRTKYLSKENAPDWVGGPKTYRGRGWKARRLEVIEKQAGKCASCGIHKGESLPVHHIKPFRDFNTAEEANDISNLIGLCQSCHMKAEHEKVKVVPVLS